MLFCSTWRFEVLWVQLRARLLVRAVGAAAWQSRSWAVPCISPNLTQFRSAPRGCLGCSAVGLLHSHAAFIIPYSCCFWFFSSFLGEGIRRGTNPELKLVIWESKFVFHLFAVRRGLGWGRFAEGKGTAKMSCRAEALMSLLPQCPRSPFAVTPMLTERWGLGVLLQFSSPGSSHLRRLCGGDELRLSRHPQRSQAPRCLVLGWLISSWGSCCAPSLLHAGVTGGTGSK